MMASDAEFELSVYSQADPFPFGPIATAIYINQYDNDKKKRIAIKQKTEAEPSGPHAAVLRKREYVQLNHTAQIY